MEDELKKSNSRINRAEIDREAIQAEAIKLLDKSHRKEIQLGLAQYEKYRITNKTAMPSLVPIILINKEIISTECYITTISGASKSGKSAFTSILLAGAISQDGKIDGLEGVQVKPNTNKKAVLHFDTEQSRHNHHWNHKSILKRCSIDDCPEYFLSYNIRELDISDYQNVTSDIFKKAYEKFNGIHLAVIDGAADYIKDVNEPAQSNQIIKFFEELANTYKTTIILIIHTNPGSDKERGHLGSQCQRKSESVLIVKTENDISYIEPKFLRNAGKGNIPRLQFTFDKEKGYHVGYGIKSSKSENIDAKRIVMVQNLCNKVFSGQKSFSYNQAIDTIMKFSKMKKRTAKDYFTTMNVHKMIIQGDDKNWRKSI